VNNPTLRPFCKPRLGRADIEGSKSNVAVNAWLPQASYPCGNFSDTSARKGSSSCFLLGMQRIRSLPQWSEIVIRALGACTRVIHCTSIPLPYFCGARSREGSIVARLKLKDGRGTYHRYASTDSGLEAFSHNPTDGSVSPLACRPRENTNYLNRLFLSY